MGSNFKLLLIFIVFLGCTAKVCLYSYKGKRICYSSKTIVETKNMLPIDWEKFVSKLSSARVIYIGERHDRREDHLLELNIAKALYKKGIDLAIGLEMVMRTRQAILDDWVAEKIDKKELLRRLQWKELWGHKFSYYQDIFSFARQNHIPLIALNAPPGLVKKVALYGLNSLLPGEKKYVAKEIDLTDKEHKEFVRKEFEKHKIFEKKKKFFYFYEAQCVWDETMAETIANYLKAQPNKHLLIITGKGHIVYKFGIPKRVWRRLSTSYYTVVSVAEGHIDPKIADFIYLIP